MTRKAALQRLVSRLIARRNALRKTIQGDLDSFHIVTEGSGVGDDVDAAVDSEAHEICSQLVEIESRELSQIEHALERIAAGVYGRCEFCGGRIRASRLSALPYTTSCINCQREMERHGRSGKPNPDSKHWMRVYEEPIGAVQSEAQTQLSDFGIDLRESSRWPMSNLLA